VPTVLTHAVFAAATFSLVAHGRRGARLGAGVAAAISMLPDIDVTWWDLTSYGAPWGHRGMTHSLAAAAIVGALAAWACRRRVEFPGGTAGLFAIFFVSMASHGVMDALTDGGKGVGFFLPFVDERYFLPIRPVPAAPISPDFTSPRVWSVIGAEALLFWPLALGMWSARRPLSMWRAVGLATALITCAIAWGWRSAG
jgi:inner membrane protein